MESLRKKLALGIGLLVLAVAGILLWRTWPSARTNMASYAPASSLVFVQVDRIPEVANGLTGTSAWRLVSPAFGLPERLELGGPVAAALDSLGLGGDDAIALGRAQLAAVITGLEAATEAPVEGAEAEASLVLKPRLALLFETHLPERAVRASVRARLPEVARKMFGDDATLAESLYDDIEVTTARPAMGDRQLVCAVRGGLVVIANHPDAMRSVLDTAAGGTPSLARDFYLAKVRPEVSADRAAVFAYFSEAGVGKLVGLGPGVVAGTITADPAKAATVSRLFGGMSEKAVKAVGYSGTFENGVVVDRYFTVLAPPVADALAKVRPASGAPVALALVPEGVVSVTYLRVAEPGQAFETLLAAVSSSVDAGTALVLGQVAIELRRSYGVEPESPISPALGDEVLFVDMGDGRPLAAVFAVRDRGRLLPVAEAYMRKEAGKVSVETYGGMEILRSEGGDGPAVAFVGDHAIVATRDQIVGMIDARQAGGRNASAMRQALERSPNAVLVSQRDDKAPTGELFLALSGRLGVSEGTPESLDAQPVRDALAQLPPSASVTEPRGGGLYSETRSAVGNFAYLTAVVSSP
jgi:hypothetical protein